MREYESACIYRRKADGLLLVQRQTRLPGAAAMFEVGEPTVLPPDSDLELFEAVVSALDRFGSSTTEAPPRSEADPKFFSRHDCLSIKRRSGLAEVIPMERVSGGYQSIEAAKVQVVAWDAEHLGAAIRVAMKAIGSCA